MTMPNRNIEQTSLQRTVMTEALGAQALTFIRNLPGLGDGQLTDHEGRPIYVVVFKGPMLFAPFIYSEVTAILGLEMMAALIAEMMTSAESADFGPALTHLTDQMLVKVRAARAKNAGETGVQPE